MESGSSNCGGSVSLSRPRNPSGDPCIDELFVRSRALSGVMTGEACIEEEELAVEALMADTGKDDEYMGGRKDVWTLLGFARLVVCIGVDCGMILGWVGAVMAGEVDWEDMVREQEVAAGSTGIVFS